MLALALTGVFAAPAAAAFRVEPQPSSASPTAAPAGEDTAGDTATLADDPALAPALPPPAAGALEREAVFDLGLRYLTGITELRGLTGGLTLLRRSDRLETIFDVDADYLATSERVLRRYAQAAATADLWPRGRWSPFALLIWTKDELARLDNRWQVGVGVKRLLAESPGGKHSLSLAVLWEDQEPTRAALRHDEGLFASLRLKDTWAVGEHSSLSTVVFCQPEISDAGRYRAFAEATFETSITRASSLRLEVADEYDSQPLDSTLDRNQVVSRLLLRYRRRQDPAEATP